ncbi:MAG: xanthine dehydrogenase accessory protein XdhC [Pirellulales bacterium]|nr:xanthine dehydrogenase accessory protein XdhC [Pirellulales bacterium]
MPTFIERYVELAAAGTPFVAVTLVDAAGSTPQDAGSKMLVTAARLDHGTVGGGKVEAKAIGVAQDLLASGERTAFRDWSLKADVGMTCGGRVRLYFEAVNVAAWRVVVFGAGHVTQALAPLLAALPCTATVIDPRREWIERLPDGVAKVVAAHPPDEVAKLADDAFVLCMTQGHSSDLPVLVEIFRRERPLPFVGVIGSDAKAAVLRKDLAAAGVPTERITFHCPVGLPLGTNHPAEIAVSIAAQLLQVRDALQGAIR